MLTERQQLILRLVVDDYIRSAEPVGSRAISKHVEVQLSPATIRNEMSDLEEMGYLEQPHTSAGRVPSQKGYRFYVDHLLRPSDLKPSEINKIRRLFRERLDAIEHVVQQTADILSTLTNYTAFVLGPMVEEAKLRHIQVVPLGEWAAVAILVTDTGHVEKKTVILPDPSVLGEIHKLVELLNHRLVGVSISELKERIEQEIGRELHRHVDHYERVLNLVDELTASAEERVYVGGTTKILEQPEFRDVEKIKPLLVMLEDAQVVARLVGSPSRQGVQVRIGEENQVSAVRECSVVTATYRMSGGQIGTIGVVGPTRMEYGRVIGVLQYLSGLLTELFNPGGTR
ncbi:MAG: heat-inducible transcription repressor HrcA [Alicyclobacillaceae bacterium]|nr:heat-inducible transcription repressor HrcA [Alicyclobacillaceae bacterium]